MLKHPVRTALLLMIPSALAAVMMLFLLSDVRQAVHALLKLAVVK